MPCSSTLPSPPSSNLASMSRFEAIVRHMFSVNLLLGFGRDEYRDHQEHPLQGSPVLSFCQCDLFMESSQLFAMFSPTLSPSTTSVWTLAAKLRTSCARFSPLRRTGGTNTDFQTWRYSLWNLPNPGRSSSRSTPSGPSWPRTTERSSTQPVEDSSLTASRLLPGLMTTTRWISHSVLFCF